jgi:internalin A
MEISFKARKNIEMVKQHGWQVLDLSDCGLTQIPEEVYTFSDLKTLKFDNTIEGDEKIKNKIKEISPAISNLKNLASLSFIGNKIKSLPKEIADLRKLTTLDLTNNRLVELNSEVAEMNSLKNLHLKDNPLQFLPPEIAERGINAIRNFFKELDEKDYLYEVKLLFVGEGRVGKTCLSKAITTDDFVLEDQSSTEGIAIGEWTIEVDQLKKLGINFDHAIKVNLWDFGGQEIYHSTHQFFLTKRSVYVLVTESRKEDHHDDFYYWLNVIKLLGDKSPVVIILNKCDQPTKELPFNEYKRVFENIVHFQKLSLKKTFEHTVNSLKCELTKIVSELPHIGTPLPKKWVDIRKELEELKRGGRDYIEFREYKEICANHYRNEASALFLSEYFHDLGVALHFQDDIDLREIMILNHDWITQGVYKILDNQKVIDKGGRFNNEDLLEIWDSERYKNKIKELISLMRNQKFDLCFELDRGEYLAPRLLPVDEVNVPWNSTQNLRFEIRYKFMPKGILTRLIVKRNKDIKDQKYWRYGVLLEHEETRALIKEKYFEQKITIELEGKFKKEFLAIIRKSIQEIHSDFKNLIADEMIPCNCKQCFDGHEPHFYPFTLLRRYEMEGLANIRCNESLTEVPVNSLINSAIETTPQIPMSTVNNFNAPMSGAIIGSEFKLNEKK